MLILPLVQIFLKSSSFPFDHINKHHMNICQSIKTANSSLLDDLLSLKLCEPSSCPLHNNSSTVMLYPINTLQTISLYLVSKHIHHLQLYQLIHPR